MSYARVRPAIVFVNTYKDLQAQWLLHGSGPLISHYVCEERLSKTKLKYLPGALRRMLRHGEGSEVA